MTDQSQYTIDPYWQYGPGRPYDTFGRERVRTIMTTGQISSQPSLSFASMDLLGRINELAALKSSIENIAIKVAEEKFINKIHTQLAPGQQIELVYSKTGDGQFKVTSINRPGLGYLYDPNKTSVVQLRGRNLEACYIPGKAPPERVEFFVDEGPNRSVYHLRDALSERRKTKAELDHRKTSQEDNKREKDPLERDKTQSRPESFSD